MKKKLCLGYFAVIICLLVCQSSGKEIVLNTKENGYEINGFIKDADNVVVRLEKAGTIVGHTFETLESITIYQGKISFRGNLDYPEMRYLFFESLNIRVPIFLDNSEIVITGNIENIKIEGSASHKAFAHFRNEMEKIKEQNRHEFLLQEVKSNPNSMLSLYILVRYLASTMDYEELNPLVELLPPPLLKSDYGLQLVSRVKTLARVRLGKIAPDFQLPNNSSQLVSLSSLKGKIVLIDFWATWCLPCREEILLLIPLYKKYKDQGFEILGVSLDFNNNKQKWEKYIREIKMDWINVANFEGFDTLPAQLYAVKSLPTKFVLNKQGVIIAKNPSIAELEILLKNHIY